MKIVAMAGTKGGSGKSTVAIHLAGEFMLREYRVLLVDGDKQGTVHTWANIADQNEMLRPAAHVHARGRDLEVDLRMFTSQGDFDIAIVDCPGTADDAHKDALRRCHLAILPVGPSPTDVWALGESMDLARHLQAASNPAMQIAVLMNRVSKTTMSKTAHAAILREADQTKAFKVMGAALASRTLYSEALAQGDFVSRYKPSSLAQYEISRLADNVEHALKIKPFSNVPQQKANA